MSKKIINSDELYCTDIPDIKLLIRSIVRKELQEKLKNDLQNYLTQIIVNIERKQK